MMAKKRLKLIVILLISILLFPIITLTPNIKAEVNKNILTEKNKLTMGLYYVSTIGSDTSGDGSITNPWRTIQKAASLVSAGDNVFIRAGTYNEKVTITGLAGSGSWITFQPYNNEQVIVDGTGVTGSYDGVILLLNGCNFIRITGLEIKNASYAGVMLYGGEIRDIRVDNCVIDNCQGSGIYAYSAQHSSGKYVRRVEFDNNNVHDVNLGRFAQEAISFSYVLGFDIHHNYLAQYEKEGLSVKGGSTDGTVHHNIIDTSTWSGAADYNHIGVYVCSYSSLIENVEVYNNYIFGNHGQGIIMRNEEGGTASNIKVYNNVINLTWVYGYGMGCCSDSPTQGYFQDIIFNSNTVYTNMYPIRFTGDTTKYINVVQIKNNIVTSPSITVLLVVGFGYNANKILLTNNLFYSFSGKTRSSWNGVTGQQFGDNAIIQNPLFVSLPTDYHLQGTSPAIDAGDPTNAPLTDYDGKQRPLGTGYDIGAHEYDDNKSFMIIKPIKALYVSNIERAPFSIPLIIGPIDIEVNIPNGLEIKRVEILYRRSSNGK
jgi:hypothetical protein